MSDVVIAGIGYTEVGEHWEIGLRELAVKAIHTAINDCGNLQPEILYAANMLAPLLSSQAHLATLLVDNAGLGGIEAATVEAGGSSGGAALRSGYMAVAAGMADVALVVGVEKLSEQTGESVEAALATNIDSDFEAPQGLNLHAQAALIMQRYLHEFNTPRESFAGFAVNAHANGALNPAAMFRSAISEATYNHASLVVDPLNLFDIAPLADGAAALVLTRPERLPPNFTHPLVRISGSAMVNDRLALHDRLDLLDFPAARRSIQRACAQAGITPGEVDFFELHDAYSIYTALSLEAAGMAPRGEGWKLAQDGKIGLDGLVPISTFGGLKARGNPGGATGVYQAVEAVLQLRGQAGPNQVPSAQRGLVQCLGGAAATAVSHVLEIL
jgi:acetyl-CoA C-acetyltransferase